MNGKALREAFGDEMLELEGKRIRISISWTQMWENPVRHWHSPEHILISM